MVSKLLAKWPWPVSFISGLAPFFVFFGKLEKVVFKLTHFYAKKIAAFTIIEH